MNRLLMHCFLSLLLLLGCRREATPPGVSGIVPRQAPAGTSILLTGERLGDVTLVLFGPKASAVTAVPTDVSDRQLRVVVPNLPSGATSVRVRVADGRESNSWQFTVQ
ncbi:MAG: IPT/TIG domain-containing protein [Sphingobacteriaceae bacterium]|nr:IPT/TIG domain-containing protein [Cytophagaceae bacterium]